MSPATNPSRNRP